MKSFADILAQSSDYADDLYGLVTNQISHIALGAVAFYLCYRIFKKDGVSLMAIFSFYFFAWELMVQGWAGGDTVADTSFVMLGAIVSTGIKVERPIFALAPPLTILALIMAG